MEKNLFKISVFNKQQDFIFVDLEKDNCNCVVPITVDVKNYEFWLMTNNKLEWSLEYTETPKTITTTKGKMSKEEYWSSNNSFIKDDIYSYICSNKIMFRGEVCEDSVSSILNAFINHKK